MRRLSTRSDCLRIKNSTLQHRLLIIDLYHRLRPSLHAYLCSRGLNQEHSEDIIQETFLRLVRHKVKQDPGDNLRAWVFRVAHNLSMDFHRAERKWFRASKAGNYPAFPERVDPAPNPEQLIILGERLTQFRKAFAQLTPRQRNCLLLRAEGLRYREIAIVLGISVQRVGELMQRAISLVEVGSHKDFRQQ